MLNILEIADIVYTCIYLFHFHKFYNFILRVIEFNRLTTNDIS